jgi:signal transduction histidine kinase
MFQLNLTDDTHRLTDAVRLALYRIFQESLNNIIRHSSATLITVRLTFYENTAELIVCDNGTGFQVDGEDWVEYARQGHLGLVGMKERAEATGGVLQLTSRPGEGTQIRVVVPVLV